MITFDLTVTSSVPTSLLDASFSPAAIFEPLARAQTKERFPGATLRAIRLITTTLQVADGGETPLTMTWKVEMDEAAPQ